MVDSFVERVGGHSPLSSFAEELGSTARRLEGRFAEELGLRPANHNKSFAERAVRSTGYERG